MLETAISMPEPLRAESSTRPEDGRVSKRALDQVVHHALQHRHVPHDGQDLLGSERLSETLRAFASFSCDLMTRPRSSVTWMGSRLRRSLAWSSMPTIRRSSTISEPADAFLRVGESLREIGVISAQAIEHPRQVHVHDGDRVLQIVHQRFEERALPERSSIELEAHLPELVARGSQLEQVPHAHGEHRGVERLLEDLVGSRALAPQALLFVAFGSKQDERAGSLRPARSSETMSIPLLSGRMASTITTSAGSRSTSASASAALDTHETTHPSGRSCVPILAEPSTSLSTINTRCAIEHPPHRRMRAGKHLA